MLPTAIGQRARSLLPEDPSSTGFPLLDQPFIFTNVWNRIDGPEKKALRQVCKPLRLAVDEQVTSLALIDDKPFRQPAKPSTPTEPSFFRAAGQRWPNMKRVALTCVADVQTLLSPSEYGGHAPFPRLQALTVKLVGAWRICVLQGCAPSQARTAPGMSYKLCPHSHAGAWLPCPRPLESTQCHADC